MHKVISALVFASFLITTPIILATEATTAAVTESAVASATATNTESATAASTPVPTEPVAASGQDDFMQKAREIAQSIPQVRQQIEDTIQFVTEQERRLSTQIAQLESKNAELQYKINNLYQELNAAREQLARSLQHPAAMPHNQNVGFMDDLKELISNPWVHWSAIIFCVIALLFIFLPAFKRTQTLAELDEDIEDEMETEEEYDFMNSEEAVPVKLDLARAYLDMGQYSSAREALETVIEKGNEEQQMEAKTLLSQIEQIEPESV